jgi:hypothetical protein
MPGDLTCWKMHAVEPDDRCSQLGQVSDAKLLDRWRAAISVARHRLGSCVDPVFSVTFTIDHRGFDDLRANLERF